MLKVLTAKKRLCCLLAAVVFAVGAVPVNVMFNNISAQATEDTFTFNLAGDGTENSPYLISKAEDLETMRDAIDKDYKPSDGKQSAVSAYYQLTADIENLGNWTPIGRNGKFTGTFDGNCHTISGMNVIRVSSANGGRSDSNYYGLFGCIGKGGTVKNLAVEGKANVASGWYVGLIAGLNEGKIENCSAKGEVSATYQYGGIAGFTDSENSGINNCYADTTSNGKGSTKFGSVAGYVGANSEFNGNCYKDNGFPDSGMNAASKTAAALKDEDVKSGKGAWLLRNAQKDNKVFWGQKLSEDTEPKLYDNDSNRVYRAEFMLKGEVVAEQFVNLNGKFTEPTNITYESEGYTAGDKWYTVDSTDGNFDDSKLYTFSDSVTKDITLYSSQVPKKYTVTLETGEGSISDESWTKGEDNKYTKTYTKEDNDFTLPTPTAPEGHTFVGWVEKGKTDENTDVVIKKGSYGDKTYTAVYRDTNGAVITVELGEHKWEGMLTNFKVYIKEQKATVKATAEDVKDSNVTLQYLISTSVYSEEQLKNKNASEWIMYSKPVDVDISANATYVYFKATDSDKNVTFASSAGIIFDINPPVISGVSNGGTYCGSIVFTVSDTYLSRVTVDDTTLFDDSGVALSAQDGITAVALGNQKFSVTFSNETLAEVVIIAVDKAGNETTYNVKISGRHIESSIKRTEFTRQPTCINQGEGYINTYCKNCGQLIKRDEYTQEKLDHSFSTWTVVSSKTCGDTTKQRKCRICGLVETVTEGGSHTWSDEYTVDKTATCINPGQKSKHCTKCGLPNPDDTIVIPTLQHTLGNADVETVKEATCTSDGARVLIYRCKDCSCEIERVYEVIPEKGHSFSEWEKIQTPSDPESGTMKRECSVCGYSETASYHTEHSWSDEKIIDKNPTCTTEGSKSYHCQNCGSTKDAEVIAALGHKPNQPTREEVFEPTCTKEGRYNEVVTCSVCGEVISKKPVTSQALGHSFGAWEEKVSASGEVNEQRICTVCGFTETGGVDLENHKWTTDYVIDKDPTCTTEGSKSYHCTVCGFTKNSVVIPALGHKFGEWTEVKTATGDVNEQRICTVCGFTETRGIDLENHKWTTDYVIDKEPSCTTEGSKSYHCTVCGLKKDSVIIPAAGHDWSNWETVSSPDCDDSGTKQRHCKVCLETETDNLSASGHTWEDHYTVDKEPTCTADGSKSVHCSKCDAVKDSEVIPAVGHHTPAADRAGVKAPTTTSEGYTGDVVCEKCGEVIEKGEAIPAVGEPELVTEVGNGAPTITLSDDEKTALENAALTDEERKAAENGADVKILLSVSDAGNTVTAEDKALAEAKIKGKYKSGQYIDIEILKRIDGRETQVTQLTKEVSLTVTVPDELKSNGRTFAIVRIHDGTADILNDTDTDADTITFKTDKFSVYEIVYTDGNISPDTGSSIPPVIAVSLASVIASIFIIRKKKH